MPFEKKDCSLFFQALIITLKPNGSVHVLLDENLAAKLLNLTQSSLVYSIVCWLVCFVYTEKAKEPVLCILFEACRSLHANAKWEGTMKDFGRLHAVVLVGIVTVFCRLHFYNV